MMESFLRGCLAKNPKERVRDIGDGGLAMKGAFDRGVSASAEQAAAPVLQVWQRPMPAAALALVIAAIAKGCYKTARVRGLRPLHV